jgi:hypothetical protein
VSDARAPHRSRAVQVQAKRVAETTEADGRRARVTKTALETLKVRARVQCGAQHLTHVAAVAVRTQVDHRAGSRRRAAHHDREAAEAGRVDHTCSRCHRINTFSHERESCVAPGSAIFSPPAGEVTQPNEPRLLLILRVVLILTLM